MAVSLYIYIYIYIYLAKKNRVNTLRTYIYLAKKNRVNTYRVLKSIGVTKQHQSWN